MMPNGRRPLLAFALCLVVLTGAWPAQRIARAQPAPAGEAPQRVLFHPAVAPLAALGQPLASVQGAGAPDPKQVALDFVAGPASASIATAAPLVWSVESTEPLDATRTLVRLGQSKDAIPVFGAQLALQVEGDRVLSAAGAYLPDVAAGPKPALSLDAAFKVAAAALAPRTDAEAGPHEDEHVTTIVKPVLAEHELTFLNPALFDAGPPVTSLSYRLVVEEQAGTASMTIFVDAVTGKVLLTYANIVGARNRQIRDANNIETTVAAACHTEGGPVGNPGGECLAAFQYSGQAYDYYFATFGRDSFDARGAAMIGVVRYGSVANAFWNGQVTSYGPGWATRDIVGHEWTHAVTQYTAGLVYRNQSGALNEAFSDIFGAMIDRDDWLLGEDTPGGALRDLSNPPRFNDPDRVGSPLYQCDASDNGGVHTNSGIPNKLASLLAEGGTFNGRTIGAIGRDATERIFYRALTTYLTPSSTFADLHTALVSAAADLFGAGSNQFAAVQAASAAVELTLTPCGGGGGAPDAFEPDNSAAVATPIATDGTAQDHTFHVAGDFDWVRFAAVAGGSYEIRTSNLQPAADTVLTLYGTDGTTVLLENDDASPGDVSSRITWTAAAAGTFYVRVRHFRNSGGVNTGYRLSISGTAPGTAPDAFEPDNSQAAARPITVGGAPQAHTFHLAGDQDWATFSAAAGQRYVIETFDLGAGSDTVLELYDAAGALLAQNDDSSGMASRVVWDAAAAGPLYARVRHFNAAAFGPTASYSLRVIGSGAAGDSFEPDNASAQARAIAIDGSTQRHTFHIAGDQDWVRFDASAGNTYIVETLNLAQGNDTLLRLYNGGGTLLVANDDFDGLASRVAYTASANDTFFAQAVHFSSASGSNQLGYDIRVSVVAVGSADAFEPDNAAGQARPIVPNAQPQDHTFHAAGDQDWVRFDAVAGNIYTLATSDLEARSDTIIDLIDSDGATVLASDDDGGSGRASRIVWVAPRGATFFARVRHFSPAVSGAATGYRLRIGGEGDPGTQDAFEPDNVMGAARPIAVNGEAQEHTFHVAGDQDWVQFGGAQGVSYRIFTFGLGTRSDTVLELYDGAGTLLAQNDDSEGFGSQISWRAGAGGPYFVKVRHFSPQVGGANTQYRLRVTADTADAYEPDNGRAAARPIGGETQAHTFHTAGDHDWVQFGASSGTIYTIATGNLGACGDTVLGLYSGNGTLLAENDDYGGLASRIVWRAGGNGTLYVRARHFSGEVRGACTSYELAITGVANGDGFEPDDTIGAARPIIVGGPAQAHTFHAAGDHDWVQFGASAGTIYTIATGNLGACGDTVLGLYGSNGTLLAENDDYGGLASRIVWSSSTSTTYFVRVRHFNPSVAGGCASYQVSVSSSAVPPDAYEPDNSRAAARPIALGELQNRSFHVIGDHDWVRFDAGAGVSYTIITSDLGAAADTVLDLYDSNGRLLASNDDYSGLASRIVWTAPAAGTFYVDSRAFGLSGGVPDSNYRLQIVAGTPGVVSAAAPVTALRGGSDGDLPGAAAGELRLSAVEVQGTPQVGQEFTMLVRAEGAAARYKLVAAAKPGQLQLVSIQPLLAGGGAFDAEGADAGQLWQAQRFGQADLAFNQPWSAESPTGLVELRWRVLSAPQGGRVLELPISLVGLDADGRAWDGGSASVFVQVAGGVKIESVTPASIALVERSYLTVVASGLTELPKVALIAGETAVELPNVSFAPESDTTLIVEVPGTTKPGTYKLRLALSDGTSAVADTTVTLTDAAPAEHRVSLPIVRR